jgi:hypothetical protein
MTVPRTGGPLRVRRFPGCGTPWGEPCPHRVVADGEGFVALASPVVVAERTGARARLLVTDTVELRIPDGAGAIAVADDRVYVAGGAPDGDGHALIAFPRDGGGELLPFPGSVRELAGSADGVWVTHDPGDDTRALELVPLDGGAPRRLVSASYLGTLAAADGVAVVDQEGSILAVPADGRPPRVIGSGYGETVSTIAIAGDRAFWVAERTVWSAPLDASSPAAEVGTLPAASEDWVGHLAIDGGTVYLGGATARGRGIFALAAGREPRLVWEHAMDRSLEEPPYLQRAIVLERGALFASVGTRVLRIDPRSGAETTILDDPAAHRLFAPTVTGGRLIARAAAPDPDTLVELPLDGSPVRTLLRSYGNTRTIQERAVVGDRLVVYAFTVEALLIVRLGQLDEM